MILDFVLEILNQTLDKIENSFYPAFKNEWHVYYDSYNYSYIDSLPDIAEEDSFWDSDYDPMKPINIGQDFGVRFTNLYITKAWLWIKIHKRILSKDGEWMKEVLNKFIKYYKHHINKTIYYDCDQLDLIEILILDQ